MELDSYLLTAAGLILICVGLYVRRKRKREEQ